MLQELAPSRRARIFAGVTSEIDLGQARLSSDLLDLLPHEVRVEQARRMLSLPAIHENGSLRRGTTGYLPYSEALALLEAEVRDPDASVRASVYQAVVGAAGRSRQAEQVVTALDWAVGRVRNDQDPVRLSLASAVGELPRTMLGDALTPALETLLTDALEARDTSWATRSALTAVAERAVVQGALSNRPALLDWGLQAHGRLSENRGWLDLHGLVENLPHERDAEVYDVLRPSIEVAAKRNEFGLAMAVATTFGRRAWKLQHLQDVLEEAVWSNQEHTVQEACRYWLDAPRTRADRAGQIIKRDVRMARWSPVWWAVTEFRTDLLDPVFKAADRIRRFDRNSLSWHVPDYALRRWLPRQQARYAELVAGVARDSRMPEWYRAAAVKTLGHVPGATLDEFLASDDVLLQEAALGSLAWTERPDRALPVLLAHAGDDRARVAMYAAARAARYVRPSLLPGLLQPVLLREGVKVTSRKAAVRMLGELRSPGASAVLTEAWAGAHRDVRAAIASTVSQYLLYDAAAWAVLEQAVHDSAATAIVLTQRRAYDMPLEYRARYADLLIAVSARSEPEVVGPALLALRQWARYNRAAARVCADFITDLSLRSRVWLDGTTALVGIVATNPDDGLAELIDTVQLLVRLESDPSLPDAEPDRDHPARQRLSQLVGQLVAQLGGRSAEVRELLKPVAAELTAPDFLNLRLQLLVTALQTNDLLVLHEVVGQDPLAAVSAADLLRSRLAATEAHWTPSELVAIAETLAGSGGDPADGGDRHRVRTAGSGGDPVDGGDRGRVRTAGSEADSADGDRRVRTLGDGVAAGLLALPLVASAGPRSGWSPEWRRVLIALRNHPSPAVRRQALDLTTAPER
ncbi:hypothetical protein AB0E69_38515 [Kribbella sp. NPDC026611]|uniref:hypothetical protein n=1 Tax=Kribbella sp. NPDC026611 TaxID=3154911 RepID=UPI0033DB3F95